MKRFLIIILIFFSCSENSKPDNLMTEQQMVDFLFDVNIINSSRSFRNISDLNYYNIKDTLLYKIHNIDSLQFAESNFYYSTNPKLYLKIYSSLQKKMISVRDSIELELKSKSNFQENKSIDIDQS